MDKGPSHTSLLTQICFLGHWQDHPPLKVEENQTHKVSLWLIYVRFVCMHVHTIIIKLTAPETHMLRILKQEDHEFRISLSLAYLKIQSKNNNKNGQTAVEYLPKFQFLRRCNCNRCIQDGCLRDWVLCLLYPTMLISPGTSLKGSLYWHFISLSLVLTPHSSTPKPKSSVKWWFSGNSSLKPGNDCSVVTS